MSVNRNDTEWAIARCQEIQSRVLASGVYAQNSILGGVSMPGCYRLTRPPESGSVAYGEGPAEEWLAWFAGLKGYYHATLRYLRGERMQVQQYIDGLPQATTRGANEFRGAQAGANVWFTVLKQRGQIQSRGNFHMSQLQWAILENETIRSNVFDTVKTGLQAYVNSESIRWARRHGGRAEGVRLVEEDHPIHRGQPTLYQRNTNYDGQLHLPAETRI